MMLNRLLPAVLSLTFATLSQAAEPSKIDAAAGAASSVATKTGKAIKHGVEKAGEAVATTAERTKEGVERGAQRIKRGAKRVKAAVTPASAPN